MENTVVSFIVENIFLFLPLGLTGIIATLFLYFTGKKENIEQHEDEVSDEWFLPKIRVNIYFLIYLLIWIVIIIIGVLSDFVIPTVVGGTIAVIPLVVMLLVSKTKKSKVM
jgi:TRAP-type C4-dicarboxylate transport system permease large subunit